MRLRLRHLATVLRRTAGPNDRGGVPTEVWAPVGDPLKVLRQRREGAEVSTVAGQDVIADHLIFAAPDPPFTAADRLVIGGVTYELVDVDPDVAGRGHHSESLARSAGTLVAAEMP
jgi:hypothetical protein